MATEAGEWGGMLARARSGDEARFLELWRNLQPRLLRYLRVLGCDDPDDVASETWLQVVRDLHRFNGDEEDFRHWLFTVGRHRAIDAARARTRHRASPLAEGIDGLPDRHMVEDQVLDGMSVAAAIEMLAGLSPDQAEAVALRVIAGLDTPAVADILGKSPGAVRVALHRGLRALAADPRVQALAFDAGLRRPARDPSPPADPRPLAPKRRLQADPRPLAPKRRLQADPRPLALEPRPPADPRPPVPGPSVPAAGPSLLALGEVE